MKKSCSVVMMLLAMVFMLAIPDITYAGDSAGEPTRVINLVYDDSGSMISDGNGVKCDTWCQAKYAMEVFAAMLGQKDSMNVYVMSDYQDKDTAKPLLTLQGANGMDKNISSIHNMLTPWAGYTTFTTVEDAYNNLLKANADEKWLVVLTDGEFNQPKKSASDIDAYFAGKSADINVMFLGMGPKAVSITANEGKNIYFEKAETSDDILGKMSGICNRIFKTNRIDVDVATGKFNLEVPMSELIVFAQGEGVEIQKLLDPEGRPTDGGLNAVGVRYSEKACSNPEGNYANPIIDTNLVGTIKAYQGDYDLGEYQVLTDSAQTIEVYYKPNVEIMAFLTDENGNVVNSSETVEPGDYELSFHFVKPGTSEIIPDSSQLGEVTYSAHVIGSGIDPEKEFVSGEKIHLEEAVYEISAEADIPKFYTSVSTGMNMEVFKHRALSIAVADNPVYEIDKDKLSDPPVDGFTNADEATIVKVSFDGLNLSAEEWDKLDGYTLEQIDNKDFRVDFTVEKSADNPGELIIHPYLKSGKTDIIDEYHDMDIKITLSANMTGEAWSGEVELTVPIIDNRPWYWKYINKVIKAIIAGLILLIICGYLFKKKLPKKLKNQPTIECKPNRPGQKKYDRKGKFVKNRITVLLPFVAEKGTIKFLPTGVSGPSILQVKAVESKRRMEITNTGALSKNKNLLINGMPLDPNSKKAVTITASANIVYKTPDTTYSCTINR